MKNILALSVLIFLSSCERDVTFNVPTQPPKLVVNGISSINTPIRVNIGKTANILQAYTTDMYRVTDAFVQLYENNILKDTLVYNATNNSYLVKRNTVAMPGNTYLLKAAGNGFTTVEAETKTPKTITINSITRRVNARTDANGNMLDEVKITFTDDGTAANYYAFKVKRPNYLNGNTMVYGGIYCMHSSDKDIDRRNNADPTDFENCIDQEFFMSDKNFNGRVKELLLFIRNNELEGFYSPSNNRTYKSIVEINNITAEHYKYRKSYDTYQDSEDNPFAEPVLVYSNVKNGYGIFSTYSIGRDTIR